MEVKMRIFLLTMMVIVASFFCFGCTENQRAKYYGGTITEKLPAGQKLVTVTWKADSLWILTRPMTQEEEAVTYRFQEKSNMGVVEGAVVIVETTK